MKMSKLLKFLLSFALPLYAGEEEGGGATVDTHEETGEALGTGNDARVKLLEGLADNADRVREEELFDVNDDGSTAPFAAPVETPEETEGEQAKVEAVEAPKIKVNGVEMELTPELIEKASKVAAADVHLAEAARLRAEAEKAVKPAAPVVAPTAPQADSDEELLAVARAIQMGSEEEAVRALQKLRKAGPSQDDIARTIDERLSFKNAISTFNSEYDDLVSDPVLHKMVIDKDLELLKQGDNRSYLDRYRAVGNEVRDWRDNLLSSNAAKQSAAVDDKQSRKAAAAPAPKAAVARAAPKVEEDVDESPRDIVASMARSRGGPQWMQGMTKS